MILAGVYIEISALHASARFCFLLVSYRPLGLRGVVVGELREVVDNAHIYQRPKKNDAFPERAAYSRGLRHAWSMYTGGGCRSPDTASTTRDADEQHSGLLAKWRRHDR